MKNTIKLNISLSVVSQIVTLISGLIIPRLIIMSFGSEVNGLVSSLNQFLNYITLLEGGLGSVVLANMYRPLVDNDKEKLSGVIKSSDIFFKRIGLIFALYCVILGVIYPLLKKTSFSWIYVFSLTIILGVTLFTQFFFSITFKLLLRADNRLYVSLIVQIISSIIIFIGTIIVIKYFPSIHIVKAIGAGIYLIQPIIYSHYIHNNYEIDYKCEPDKEAMSQRWDCIGQNTAYFIHNNTDIVILTIFSNLLYVSVYSVHMLAINGIKSLIMTFSNVLNPVLGHSIAKEDKIEINKSLDTFEFIMSSVATISFGCCIVLLTPFVSLYTSGVNDTSYYFPAFAIIISLSEYIYCIRDPYISVAYAAGQFKETARSAYLEALINIFLSIILVRYFGLLGVAIGTLCGMFYRMIYQIIYIKNNIAFRPIRKSIKRLLINFAILFIGYSISLVINYNIINFLDWTFAAAIYLCIFSALTVAASMVFYKSELTQIYSKYFKRN